MCLLNKWAVGGVLGVFVGVWGRIVGVFVFCRSPRRRSRFPLLLIVRLQMVEAAHHPCGRVCVRGVGQLAVEGGFGFGPARGAVRGGGWGHGHGVADAAAGPPVAAPRGPRGTAARLARWGPAPRRPCHPYRPCHPCGALFPRLARLPLCPPQRQGRGVAT